MKLALSLTTVTAALCVLLLAGCRNPLTDTANYGAPATAPNAAPLTGEQIASRILRSSAFGWDGAKSRVKMILTKGGDRKERVMDVLSRRKDGRGQTVIRFHAPPDVAGTAFLVLEQKDGGFEQYVYLPNLKRTRQIKARHREGSFLGSDFSYADMRRIAASLSTHKRLPDDKIGDSGAFVVESTPKKGAKVPYAKLQVWVRKSDFIPLRTRFYGAGGELVKTLYARKVGKLDNRPAVLESLMENGTSGHSTLLVVESMERLDNLPDSAFTPTALEHP